MHPVTVEKCEKKFQTLKLQLNIVFRKWEQSSQGCDGVSLTMMGQTAMVMLMRISFVSSFY